MKVEDVIFTAEALEDGEIIEMHIEEIGVRYGSDDVFYYDPVYSGGEAVACKLSSLSIKSEKIDKLKDQVSDLSKKLQEGRHYLMGVRADKITVEDALEAFGFGRDGMKL